MSARAAGRELDALVAEHVMGWPKWDTKGDWGGPRDVTHFGDWEDGVAVYEPADAGAASFYFSPSTDIADAWRVVEKLRADDLRPVLMPDWGTQWQCVIYRQAEYIAQSAFVDSLPLAICQAALLVLEARV